LLFHKKCSVCLKSFDYNSKRAEQCECKRVVGRRACVCLTCGKPRASDLSEETVEDDPSRACECTGASSSSSSSGAAAADADADVDEAAADQQPGSGFKTACDLDHKKYIQLRSDPEMYELFETLYPAAAKVCSYTTFIGLKPWYVKKPNARTCVCVYHNEMKMALEDQAKAHRYVRIL
jgi:hypothetical protein